ncbi:hypothetical protein UAY_01930 [Enterococcus moraviensis ATCC BAA-383]|uniref:Peptidase M56 domain-containing protein n=1 Tax=Enterococcus moraviensis ATCC BAA-383 TaxID=1158609 RepID=R2QUY2_9ENTE|nr:M56 family metallopeptidase [Enterococcus moraviensis]EOH99153.1 hypothetical protein UAY_01930 [Enterococcus moraviensis ATCC BAA-383]EOT72164.1 hypothetical protein I586_01972 [Enterococcus moraviensis ATCC BAA-383]
MRTENILNLLISLSISGSILFGIWRFIRFFLKEKYSRRLQYYLLLVVLLRFVLPFSPNESIVGKLFSSIESTSFYEMIYGSPIKRNPTIFIGDNVSFNNNIIIGSKEHIFAPYILSIWLIVALGLMIRKLTKYQSFTKYVKSDWQPINDPAILDILATVCEEKRVTAAIDAYTTPLITSPLLLGGKKNYIVLPHEHLSYEQLYSIFSHEMTHYKNRDLLYKWFMQLILCIHWFNPFVYFIEKVMNQECEYACDEATTQHFTNEQQFNYGATLIDMAKHSGRYNEKVASITLYENTSEIKNRLEAMLLFEKRKKLRRTPAILSITILVVIAFFLGAYTTRPIENQEEDVPTDTITPTPNKPLGRHFS